MKIMLITTPIRPVATSFPPIGSLSIIKYLRKHGIEVEFYNIDANRPEYENAIEHILDFKPDVLGISAVVSTAYSYTKQLSLDIKAKSPNTLVVVGGNLAASAEVLLRCTGIDLCVIGEGERVFLDICNRAETTKIPFDYSDIPGLSFLDTNKKLVNTGFVKALDKSEVYDYDYEDIEKSSDINLVIMDGFDDDGAHPWFKQDPRTYEVHRRDKKVTLIPGAKGCVARCTFCHRWDKGIRYIPVDQIMARIELVMERYNVGFIAMGDENFGTDSRWLDEFCEKISKYDVLWHVGGMRVNKITPEKIAMMKEAGCCSIMYGMESGSPDMLQIMEKKTTVEQNRNAMSWTVGAGLNTVVQLVLGMPGETSKTIRETTDFCKYAMTLYKSQNPNCLSINYAQALPGTPLYEYARHKNLIGRDLESEEQYLHMVSDINAAEITHNLTNTPDIIWHLWRTDIHLETLRAYVKKFGIDHYRQVLIHDANYFKQPRPVSGYFNYPKMEMEKGVVKKNGSESFVKDSDFLPNEKALISDTIHKRHEAYEQTGDRLPSFWQLFRERKVHMITICYPNLVYLLRRFILPLYLIRALFRGQFTQVRDAVTYVFLEMFHIGGTKYEYKSLRRIVEKDLGGFVDTNPAMESLRRGR